MATPAARVDPRMRNTDDLALPAAAAPAAPRVVYRPAAAWAGILDDARTLAALRFGADQPIPGDPRAFAVRLDPLGDDAGIVEQWLVDGPVQSGFDGALRWSAGSGWLFAALELDEAAHGGTEAAAEHAYAGLCAFLRTRGEAQVMRLWNYLGAINQGEADAERYRRFCAGRARGMGAFFADGFPAATAIGHHADAGCLQIYLLACTEPGVAVENPRQLSAWRYPRQYGPTSPSFARAMRLPAHDALAISGTAAVVGHASAHAGKLDAQMDETLRNLDALLASARMPAGFDARSPLKAYLRHPADAPAVRAALVRRFPDAPVLALHGDICRRELLVEIDGWRFA